MTKFELLQKLVSEALKNGLEGCLIWPYQAHGYYPSCKTNGKMISCHRYACEARHGPSPVIDGVYIDAAHSCGVKHCISPWHLEWKTRKENIADNYTQGKMLRGSKIGVSKLTEAEVETIRIEYAAGRATQVELAERFGVTNFSISLITIGKTWAHVGGPRITHPDKDWNQGSRHFNARLNEEKVRSIRDRKIEDPSIPTKVFAEEYRVHARTIIDIFENKTWKHVYSSPTKRR